MKLFRLLPAVAALLSASFAFAEAPAAKPGALAFLRTTDAAGETRALQTASVEYRPARGSGPSVWLVGVAHLGTPEYYAAIQKRLDAMTVVLYEGVGVSDLKKGPGAATDGSGIQSKLATALGLVFQLDVIDYRRPHFINSDMHVPEMQEEVRRHSPDGTEPPSGEMLDQLMDAMRGTGVTGAALSQMVGFLGSTPQMRETTKVMLVEVLSQAGEMLQLAKTVSPEMRELFDVLLTQRNEIVIRDLRAQITKLKAGQSVAVFYGAAHMDEIATHLRQELRYIPAAPQWDTAFTASPAQSSINPAQVRLMLELMRVQLQPAAK